MFVDYVLNGVAHGPIANTLSNIRYDPGLLRPYFNERGVRCVTINTGRTVHDAKLKREVPVYREVTIDDLARRGVYSPVANATSLRKADWIQLDRVIVRAARKRLRAWADLAASNTYGGFNGMAKMTLEYEAMSDPGSAVVDMDGLSPGRDDTPLFKLRSIPLPIIHSDFEYSARLLAQSRNSDTPLDTTSGEAAGRRVGEMVEQMTIGTQTGPAYGTQPAGNYAATDGTSQVYGYTNLPARITKTNLTTPTGSNAASTLADVLAMRQTMYNNKFYGPFMLYHSTDWDTYMDNDYILTGGNVATQTLRERLKAVEDIQDVRRLDFLDQTTNPFTLLMVQMLPETARAVDGMGITTVQWEDRGGMKLKFMVMCIQVPQLRYDYNGIAAIQHATTS